MIRRDYAVLLISLCCACTTPAPTVRAGTEDAGPRDAETTREEVAQVRSELEQRLDVLANPDSMPGVGALVFDEQGVVDQGVAGLRSIDSPEPLTRADLFHLGSCTKAMTATIAARMAARGELSLDEKLAKFFPYELHASWAEVTLLDLLRHRAGAPSALPSQRPELWKKMWDAEIAGEPSLDSVRADVARMLLQTSAPHTSGEFFYSNAGYILAGAALEVRAGASWEELVSREVFGPLGMTSCGFGAPGSAERVDQPRGHRGEVGSLRAMAPVVGADNPASLGPAGSVHCTMEDWAMFARVHAGAGPEGYLSEASLDALHTPAPGARRYAAGWGIGKLGTRDVLTHSGSNTMNLAQIVVDRELKSGVLVVTNAANPSARESLNALVIELFQKHIVAP